jgi:hypothetical protein
MTTKRNSLFAVAIVVAAGACVAACSSSDGNVTPTTNPVDVDSGSDTATHPDTATSADTATGDAADAADAAWDPKSGTCFPGTPSTEIQFLNACTTADSVKWTGALPKENADGTLPPLP